MKKSIVLLFSLLAGATTQAENITNNGKIYYDIALVTNRCTAASITFSHRAGIAKLDFQGLSERNKKRFGFDPVRYQAFKDEAAKLQPQPLPMPPVTTATATSPAVIPPPVEVKLAPSKDFTPIKRVVVITNTPPPIFTPFGSSPVTTIQPDNDNMNDARSRIMKKAIGINSHNGN